VSCFNLFFDCSRGGGWKLMFFFSPSFDMWKEEGKGVFFFFLEFLFSFLSG
jgi:hypothetical protein